MSDVFSKAKRSQVMAAVRSRGNKHTEGALVAVFRQNGIKGWRRHLQLVGVPDFAFPKCRLAVFVDGCFWHGCPKHLRMPKSNRAYWRGKISRNMVRDQKTIKELRQAGWLVLRIWEHELRSEKRVLKRVLSALEKLKKHTRQATTLEAEINHAKRR
jgi:DNA mismatch endonuclease (patch repair protein)